MLARELDVHGRGWDRVGKVKNVSANHVVVLLCADGPSKTA